MSPLRYVFSVLSFLEVYSFLLETDAEFLSPLSRRVDIGAYAKKLSDFSDFSLCYDGDQLVGMISCYTNQPPVGYISNVCVKKQYQGRGVFSAMFRKLLENLRLRGISMLMLEVDAQNEKAKSIYEHFGFQEQAFNPNTNKCLMALDLA